MDSDVAMTFWWTSLFIGLGVLLLLTLKKIFLIFQKDLYKCIFVEWVGQNDWRFTNQSEIKFDRHRVFDLDKPEPERLNYLIVTTRFLDKAAIDRTWKG